MLIQNKLSAGCNAVEQLLINSHIPQQQIIEILQILIAAKVTIHVTPEIKQIISSGDNININIKETTILKMLKRIHLIKNIFHLIFR